MAADTNYGVFEKLFRLYHKELHNLAFNLVRDRDVAKDVVQEVFLRLWQNKESVEFGDQIKHYLFKATTHTAYNHLRSVKKLVTFEVDDFQTLAASPDGHDITFREFDMKVREAIDRLPPKCKAIYLLSRQEGMKYQQIADTLEISIKTVENQMGIALEKLRQDLKPYLTTEFLSIAALIIAILMEFLK